MTASELTLPDLIARAYARALSPTLLSRRIKQWLSGRAISEQAAQQAVAAALIQHILQPRPPPLILNYLAHSLENDTTARQVLISFLAALPTKPNIPTGAVEAIFAILLEHPTELGPKSSPIPSTLSIPSSSLSPRSPDVGTSASANLPPTSPEPTSFLALLLPLLRRCTLNPSSPPTQSLSPMVLLLSRVLSLLAPYPAPPFEVGFEAGQLLSSLPDGLATPLRQCLSGLMADLEVSSQATQTEIQGPILTLGTQPNGPAGISGGNELGIQKANGQLSESQGDNLNGYTMATLPLPQIFTFLLSHIHHSAIYPTKFQTPQTDGTILLSDVPPESHRRLIQLGPHLTSDPTAFLLHLLEAAVTSVVTSQEVSSRETIQRYLFLVDDLPRLLIWWKGRTDKNWLYPEILPTVLGAIFQSMNEGMTSFSNMVSTTFLTLVAASDADDETGGFVQPDGWAMGTLQETLLRNLIQQEMLTQEDATVLLPGVDLTSETGGESLLNQIGTSPRSQLPPLAIFTVYSSGASRFLATEFLGSIDSTPANPPFENLFANLSSQPPLLSSLTTVISPQELSSILTKHLLEVPEDPITRADDPQGSLMKFGEGVVLVEAVVAHFQLPLPDILDDARRVTAFGDLAEDQRSLMNGWVKALFGSDGIEDEILLVTSLQGFCRLASSVIHQSIIAVSIGQIDLDTLHSGLSYFSQPLLSWCLGGVVAWLCTEIKRQGLLSALHLDVLQNLVLSSAFPEALLRVNGKALNDILDPSSGLEAVIQSSGFDVQGVRGKLEAASIPTLPGAEIHQSQLNLSPLHQLRSNLQPIRNINLALPGWEISLLSTLEDCLSIHGSVESLRTIISEIVLPSSSLGALISDPDPLLPFASLLCLLQFTDSQKHPMIVDLVEVILPELFDNPRPWNNALPTISSILIGQTIGRLLMHPLKSLSSLVSTDDITEDTVGYLADELVERVSTELEFQKSRFGSSGIKSNGNGMVPTANGEKRTTKRAKNGRARVDGMAERRREVLEGFVEVLRVDEEAGGRWGRLKDLCG